MTHSSVNHSRKAVYHHLHHPPPHHSILCYQLEMRHLVKKKLLGNYPLKHQSHKMIKQTQTIRWQQPTNCLSVFEHFVKLALKGLTRTGGLNKTSLYTSVVTICG